MGFIMKQKDWHALAISCGTSNTSLLVFFFYLQSFSVIPSRPVSPTQAIHLLRNPSIWILVHLADVPTGKISFHRCSLGPLLSRTDMTEVHFCTNIVLIHPRTRTMFFLFYHLVGRDSLSLLHETLCIRWGISVSTTNVCGMGISAAFSYNL